MIGADLSLLPLREVCARVGLSAATVYLRGDLLDKRRALMGDWAGYLAGRL